MGLPPPHMPLIITHMPLSLHLAAAARTADPRLSKPPRRKQASNHLLFGVNPANPYESVVSASPAMRHLNVRDWRQLELLTPAGCSKEDIVALESELAHFLHDNTASSGARVDYSPPRSPLVTGLPMPTGTAASAASASAVASAAAAAAAHPGIMSPAAYGGLLPPTPSTAAAQAQGADVHGGVTLQPGYSTWPGMGRDVWLGLPSTTSSPTPSRFSSPPKERMGTADIPASPMMAWMSPRSAMSFDRTSPDLPAAPQGSGAHGGSGMDFANSGGGARQQQSPQRQAAAFRFGTIAASLPAPTNNPGLYPAQLNSLLLVGGGDGVHGSPVTGAKHLPAGYSPATAYAGAALGGTALQAGDGHITLGNLMTERQSVRRQVQLIARWLEAAVARLWQEEGALVTDLGMRQVFHTTASAAAAAAVSRQGSSLRMAQEPSSLHPSPVYPIKEGIELEASIASHLPPVEQDGQGLQAALDVLSGVPATNPALDPAAKHRGLAAKFAAFVSDSLQQQAREGSAAWASSQGLWRGMVQVVGAASGALVQHIAAGCWEEGALLARLWNLHTALLDAGCTASADAAQRAEGEVQALREQVAR